MYSVEQINFQQKDIAGLSTRIAYLGEGPVVLFLHGWPECWYSWRQQLVALANAGFQAIAPDMPGFGKTQGHLAIEDYNIENTSRFILELIQTYSNQGVILVGHDWGAINAWQFTLRHPEVVSLLINLSVPLRPVTKQTPIDVMRKRFENRFFYQLYFQTPGIAEAEFEANPEAILSRLYASPDTPREKAALSKAPPDQGGWIDRLGKLKEMPSWLAKEDLQYFVDTYVESGFAGGINYYRNIDRNWELMAPFADDKIKCPVLFVAGDKDVTLMHMDEAALKKSMRERVPNLSLKLLPNYGHWIQQEAACSVNKELIDFIHTHRP